MGLGRRGYPKIHFLIMFLSVKLRIWGISIPCSWTNPHYVRQHALLTSASAVNQTHTILETLQKPNTGVARNSSIDFDVFSIETSGSSQSCIQKETRWYSKTARWLSPVPVWTKTWRSISYLWIILHSFTTYIKPKKLRWNPRFASTESRATPKIMIYHPPKWLHYLVAHPTDRKWVTTLVIDGISGGKVHL